MNLQQQLKDQASSQSSKQLKLREEAVAEKERLLDDKDRIHKLALLDKQIAIKEDIKNNLNIAIDVLQKDHMKRLETADNETADLNKQKEKLQNDYNGLVNKKVKLDEQVIEGNHLLHQINEDINRQKEYLKEQEIVVNDTIAEWNAHLNEFQQETTISNTQKLAKSIELTQMDQELETKKVELNDLQLRINALQVTYTEQAENLRSILNETKIQIQTEENKLLEIRQKDKARLDVIASRELAIRVAEAANREKETDLKQRENALTMKLRIYDSP